ncbi:MAG: hypothetical protein FWG56_12845 [Desulfovibrionaceae bacterium]|jgi:hypothetical protein|nr:hypothetical protein [Desulfovibrionaceae bacterium]
MKPLFHLLCACAASLAGHGIALANDFPTVERVLYVQECMAAHPGGGTSFEMTSKCSCALDALARQIGYDDYAEMSTAAKATTIAGERGGEIRDSEKMQAAIKRYRALQASAEQGCFIGPAAAR